MKRRFSKLPIASIAVVIGCFLVGLSLSSADAQSALVNGSVTVRSDGAVYLITNGVRRWVATVVITDEELNAYPEAEPIYAGLAPYGSTSAGTTASTGSTASKTGSSASKTGTAPAKVATAIASKTSGSSASKTTGSTGSSSSSSSTSTANDDDEDDDGIDDGMADPGSGADPKDPNDPTLAEVTVTLDPSAKAEPTGKTTCPDTHKIKGGFDKYYWDTDRPDYASIEPEACFVSGAYAREYGYTEVKKRPSSSSSSSQ